MKVSVEAHKIKECTIYSNFFFYFRYRYWWNVNEVDVDRTNYPGCQFDVYFIQCQTSTDILGIMNDFVQYVQNYFQYVYIPIPPTISEKKISWKSW